MADQTFGEYLDQAYHKTVAVRSGGFDPAHPSDKYVFDGFKPRFNFPDGRRYFSFPVEGRVSGGEGVNLEAINNSILQGAFPGWTRTFEQSDPHLDDILNDVAYLATGGTSHGVPSTVWSAIVVPADDAWRAANSPVTPPAPPVPPTPPVTPPPVTPAPPVEDPRLPGLLETEKRFRALLSAAEKATKAAEDVPLPAGDHGGRPTVGLRAFRDAMRKALTKATA